MSTYENFLFVVYKQNTLTDFIKWYKKGKKKKGKNTISPLHWWAGVQKRLFNRFAPSKSRAKCHLSTDELNKHSLHTSRVHRQGFLLRLSFWCFYCDFFYVLMESKVDIIEGDIWSSSTLLFVHEFKYIYGYKKEL